MIDQSKILPRSTKHNIVKRLRVEDNCGVRILFVSEKSLGISEGILRIDIKSYKYLCNKTYVAQRSVIMTDIQGPT